MQPHITYFITELLLWDMEHLLSKNSKVTLTVSSWFAKAGTVKLGMVIDVAQPLSGFRDTGACAQRLVSHLSGFAPTRLLSVLQSYHVDGCFSKTSNPKWVGSYANKEKKPFVPSVLWQPTWSAESAESWFKIQLKALPVILFLLGRRVALYSAISGVGCYKVVPHAVLCLARTFMAYLPTIMDHLF